MSDIEGSPLDRLGDTFTSPYPDGDQSSEWNALLTAIANEFATLDEVRHDIENAKFVDDATGDQLEKLATIFDLERRAGELDSTFRLRIKAALRSQLSSGTVEDVRDAVAILLNTTTSRVVIQEPYDTQGIVLEVGVWNEDLEAVGVTASQLSDFVDEVTAAGVDLTVFERGTFQFTSNSTPVTSTNGFQELDGNNDPIEGTGGTWAELLN